MQCIMSFFVCVKAYYNGIINCLSCVCVCEPLETQRPHTCANVGSYPRGHLQFLFTFRISIALHTWLTFAYTIYRYMHMHTNEHVYRCVDAYYLSKQLYASAYLDVFMCVCTHLPRNAFSVPLSLPVPPECHDCQQQQQGYKYLHIRICVYVCRTGAPTQFGWEPKFKEKLKQPHLQRQRRRMR